MRDKVFSKKEFIASVTENVKTMYRKTLKEATQQEIYQAVSLAVKDVVMDEWMATQQVIEKDDPKILYYMSMEFLMGRALGNDLLDMPGVLWKKFDSKTIASNLAFIGSIKDDILDVEELAMNLLDEVRRNYPDLVAQRYKLDAETLALPPYELLEAIGRKRGLLVRGGEVNTERCAIMLVDEFRACKWGRISLERPPQRDDLADFAEEDDE